MKSIELLMATVAMMLVTAVNMEAQTSTPPRRPPYDADVSLTEWNDALAAVPESAVTKWPDWYTKACSLAAGWKIPHREHTDAGLWVIPAGASTGNALNDPSGYSMAVASSLVDGLSQLDPTAVDVNGAIPDAQLKILWAIIEEKSHNYGIPTMEPMPGGGPGAGNKGTGPKETDTYASCDKSWLEYYLKMRRRDKDVCIEEIVFATIKLNSLISDFQAPSSGSTSKMSKFSNLREGESAIANVRGHWGVKLLTQCVYIKTILLQYPLATGEGSGSFSLEDAESDAKEIDDLAEDVVASFNNAVQAYRSIVQ